MKLTRIAAAVALAACTMGARVQASTVYSASAAFESAYSASTTTGAAGQFSFGYAGSSLNSPVTPYTATTSAGTTHILTWNPSTPDLVPAVFHNSDASNASTFYTVNLDPNQLAMHPGPQGQYSVISFTAPSAGLYDVSAAFEGSDDGAGTSTDVHILRNGATLDSGFVNGFHSNVVNFSGPITLAVNDVVSFWVGFGNGYYGSDTTGFVGADLTVTGPSDPTSSGPAAVPLPASAWSGAGLLTFLTVARTIRRRRALAIAD